MVTLQILNKVIQTGHINLITDNALDESFFIGYEPEYQFILDHYSKYNKVPDKATFLSKFQDFGFIDVAESDKYLLDTLYEEHLYYKSVEVVQRVADLLKHNANDAVEYLHAKLPELKITTAAEGVNIISRAHERHDLYVHKMTSEEPWYITTGFEELDDIVHGWAKGEELVVILARTGQGKSWVLAKSLTHAWQLGHNVGYVSPEMSPIKIGYRFDTLHRNFSNTHLVWGKPVEGYDKYIDELKKHEKPFIVATPLDFGKRITVSKLKHFIITHKLDILGIDGITYLQDERYKKGDNRAIALTNISEDLMSLSLELGVPIIVVAQSNRGGVRSGEDNNETPDIENIKDSDGIAHNATKIIAIKQNGAGLQMDIKKHRDGASAGRVNYYWDIDVGDFKYIPADDDSVKPERKQEKVQQIKNSFNDGTEVF